MKRVLLMFGVALAVLPAAYAEEYWFRYEANVDGVFPEDRGWTRSHGNNQGEGEAIRTVEGGIFSSDSLHDIWLSDYVYMERPGQIDPGPGEVFVAEWRLKVDTVVGAPGCYDEEVALAADNGWIVGLGFYENRIWSPFELELDIPFEPYVFHKYRVESTDMVNYELYLDGLLVHTGTFWQNGVSESYVAWGDSAKGVASVAHWDYFRYGVVAEGELNPMEHAGNATEVLGTLSGPEPVPEPASVWMILGLLVCGGRTRTGNNGRIG